MTSSQENTLFQSEHHPLVDVAPVILEDHCLSLMHRKAYETARDLAKAKAILDLGCNDGYGTAIISAGAAKAVGVDLSSKAIDAARLAYPPISFVHLTQHIATELRAALARHLEEVQVPGLAGNMRRERLARQRVTLHVRLNRPSRAGLPGRAFASLAFRLRRALRQAAAARVSIIKSAPAAQFARSQASDLHYKTTDLGAALDSFARTTSR